MFKSSIVRFLSFLSSTKRKSKKKLKKNEDKEFNLSNSAWSIILENSSPLDLIKWRRVNRQLKSLIDNRLSRLLYLDVWRMDTNAILPRQKDSDGDFYRIRSSQLLIHLDCHSLVLVSSPHWNTKDVERLWGGLNMFRRYCMTLTLDVSVMEMVIAGMALSDNFAQWLKMNHPDTEEDRLNNNDNEITKVDDLHPEPFFPKVRELTLRVMCSEISALLSLPSYSLPLHLIIPFNSLQLFRLHLVNNQKNGGVWKPSIGGGIKTLSSNQSISSQNRLKPFKEWIRIDLLRERYCQQYS